MLDAAGSAAAPAARRRNCRRGSFIFEPPFRSFDHLVGAGEQGGWDLDPERLGGLQVDHELELGGLLDGQIGRLFAFQNSTSIHSRQPIQFREATTVADEAARCGELATLVDRRQRIFQGERSEMSSAGIEKWM